MSTDILYTKKRKKPWYSNVETTLYIFELFLIVSRQEETRSHSFQKTTKHHSNHNLFYKFIYRIKTTSQTYNTK